MIRQIISITCDWCEQTEQHDLPVQQAIDEQIRAGWIMEDGNDFCSEACHKKHHVRRNPPV